MWLESVYTTISSVCFSGRRSLFLPQRMSARLHPYADLLVESTAQSSSFPNLAARSLRRSMRCCSNLLPPGNTAVVELCKVWKHCQCQDVVDYCIFRAERATCTVK